MFDKVEKVPKFPEIEERVLALWEAGRIKDKSMSRNRGKDKFTFYEGPPTANGMPHPGHVLTRVMKDVFLRYRSMRGFDVLRKAGWDTHGLPVELEVEREIAREMGLTEEQLKEQGGKQLIEKFGVAEFVARCRKSVFRYEGEWRKMTDRVAFWCDMDDPYITCTNNYIESVWWILKKFFDEGLLYRGHKIVPQCPSCDTALSSHEVSQGYEETSDPSLYIRCPVKGMEKTSFLVWTTTPWTLISNVALALAPEVDYVKVKSGDEFFILAEARAAAVVGEGFEVVQRFKGSELAGTEYEQPFSFVKADKRAWYCITGGFVTTEDGSGIVHIAPAFGEDDYNAGKEHDLPFLQPVNSAGKFTAEVTPWAGVFVKDADKSIIENLKERGILFRAEQYVHSYPFCWRCSSPLIYYARSSWFIKTTAYKQALLDVNDEINWVPAHIRTGRMGDFLENNIDWAVSRDRYWGTPLNLWKCGGCETVEGFDSAKALKERATAWPWKDDADIDLHKPWIDEVVVKCAKCGGEMKRTPEVIDCWLDSGAMPVAQWHYPHENKEQFESVFPADYITEAIDQTRGWFYSLMALGAFLFKRSPFKTCLVLGHVLDRDGKKMSKSLGNVVDPWSAFNTYGADAFRWYFYRENNPWLPTRFFEDAMRDVQKSFFLTLWNVYSFFVIYAGIDGFEPGKHTVPVAERDPADRWALSRLNRLVREISEGLDSFAIMAPARAVEAFVDDLSNWYVRRCRPRFWKPEKDADKWAAYSTLYECIVTICKTLAPFMPYLTEDIYQNLARKADPDAPESVHLADYPVADEALIDDGLEEDMALVRDIVNEGRSLRNTAKVRVRQPLSLMRVKLAEGPRRERIEPLRGMMLDELNIRNIEFSDSFDGLSVYHFKPNLKTLGPKYGKSLKEIGEKLAGVEDDGTIMKKLEDGGAFELTLDDGAVASMVKADLLVTPGSAPGWAVGETAALDVRLTPELVSAGLAREVVHRIQSARKEMDLDYEQRISLRAGGDEKMLAVLTEHGDYLKSETLCVELTLDLPDGKGEEFAVDGMKVRYEITAAGGK